MITNKNMKQSVRDISHTNSVIWSFFQGTYITLMQNITKLKDIHTWLKPKPALCYLWMKSRMYSMLTCANWFFSWYVVTMCQHCEDIQSFIQGSKWMAMFGIAYYRTIWVVCAMYTFQDAILIFCMLWIPRWPTIIAHCAGYHIPQCNASTWPSISSVTFEATVMTHLIILIKYFFFFFYLNLNA